MQSFHFLVSTRGDACIAAFVLVITSVISVSDREGFSDRAFISADYIIKKRFSSHQHAAHVAMTDIENAEVKWFLTPFPQDLLTLCLA